MDVVELWMLDGLAICFVDHVEVFKRSWFGAGVRRICSLLRLGTHSNYHSGLS